MSNFGKFNQELPGKKKFYSLLIGKKTSNKEYEHGLKGWNKFEMKTMKDYHDLKNVMFYCNLMFLKNLELIA